MGTGRLGFRHIRQSRTCQRMHLTAFPMHRHAPRLISHKKINDLHPQQPLARYLLIL